MRRVSAFFVCLLATVPAAAQTGKDILGAWKARRDSIRSVKYVIDSTAVQHKKYAPKAKRNERPMLVAADARPMKETLTIVIDTKSGEYFWENKGDTNPISRKAEAYHGANVYRDGVLKSIKWPNSGETDVGVEHGRNSDFMELRGDLAEHAYEFKHYPVFADIGIFPLATQDKLYPGQFQKYSYEGNDDLLAVSPNPPQAGVWFDCAPKRIDRDILITSFAVDGEKRIVSAVKSQNKIVIYSLGLKWKKHATAGWSLGSWTYEGYTDKQLIYTANFTVRSVEYNFPIDRDTFVLKPNPGMVLLKLNYPDPSSAERDPEAETLKVGSDGSTTSVFSDGSSPSFVRRNVWLLAASCLTLAGIATAAYVRSKRTSFGKSALPNT